MVFGKNWIVNFRKNTKNILSVYCGISNLGDAASYLIIFGLNSYLNWFVSSLRACVFIICKQLNMLLADETDFFIDEQFVEMFGTFRISPIWLLLRTGLRVAYPGPNFMKNRIRIQTLVNRCWEKSKILEWFWIWTIRPDPDLTPQYKPS